MPGKVIEVLRAWVARLFRWRPRRRELRRGLQFNRITVPLVRRIYPRLDADHIVGVQPLREPTSLVYYLRHRYSEPRNTARTE